MFAKKIILFVMIFLLSIYAKGDESNTIFWRGRVVNGNTGEPVPNAVVAVYSRAMLYSADIDGVVRLRLPKDDSLRVVVLGFLPETFRISELQPDSAGFAQMTIYPVTRQLKEVTIKGYRGFLDPHFFPVIEDDEPKVEMRLGDIGSNMSDIPPMERLLMEKPSFIEAVISPASFIYSRFSKEQKQLRNFRRIKQNHANEQRLKDFISPEAIATISGFEDEELRNFIIYCNANLKLNKKDSGASVMAKIEIILENYKKKTAQEIKDN
ncbi:MAG: carboxypeptidase-like regulatory domain-containing protein [Marinilabiliaceae bacterium]|nr:carboxypeptidase-like regulatory domain-containing protein [Marinilabiliaceae bacterium]